MKKEVTLYEKLFSGVPAFNGLEYKGDIKKMIEINPNFYIAYYKNDFYYSNYGKKYATAINTGALEVLLNNFGATLHDYFKTETIYRQKNNYNCHYGGSYNG